jgi:hypothetical protein
MSHCHHLWVVSEYCGGKTRSRVYRTVLMTEQQAGSGSYSMPPLTIEALTGLGMKPE